MNQDELKLEQTIRIKSLGNVYLYGVFDSSEVCLYVGQTFSPKDRERTHRRLILNGAKGKLRILRTCPPEFARKLERQIMTAYRKLGQCKFNKNIGGTPAAAYSTFWIIWREGALIFQSTVQAANHFGVSTGTIRKWLARKNSTPHTLDKIPKPNGRV